MIKKYVAKQIQKASKEFDNHERRNLHRFRRRVKKVMYAYNVLPEKLQKSLELNKSNINKLQKRLGIWHDTYSAINFLSHQRFSGKNKYISTLRAKEEEQFRNLFKRRLKIKKIE